MAFAENRTMPTIPIKTPEFFSVEKFMMRMYIFFTFTAYKGIDFYYAHDLIMNRKIKLIWDFRGPEALEIAKHHCVHLKEFSDKENLVNHEVATQQISEMYSIAFITVNEADMITFRDALKPHRGEVAK